MSKGKVLWIENDPDFLNVRSEFIEAADFEVLKAFTVEEAEEILFDNWVHLVILDIRMRDDDNEWDKSGLDWADNEAYRTLPKIILTGYSTDQAIRKALRQRPNGQALAVDFLDKDYEPEDMIEAIEQAFAQYVRINWDLNIRWETSGSFIHLVNLIEPGLDNDRILIWAGEARDLFRKLFYDSTGIVIGRILNQGKGRVNLEVFSYSDKGPQGKFVVSCGRRQCIREEKARYMSFAPTGVVVGSTGKDETTETVRFAATAYFLSGGDLEETLTFKEFYQRRSTNKVLAALDHLLNKTLSQWHEKDRFDEEVRDLGQFYSTWLEFNRKSIVQEKFESQVEILHNEILAAGLPRFKVAPNELTFYCADGSPVHYPNPIPFLFNDRIKINSMVLCGTTPGLLKENSILVDHREQTWLIDFSQAGRGPLLRDFASVETVIKFGLVDTLDVQIRREMEENLLAVSSFDQEIEIERLDSEQIQKAIQAVCHIRRHALAVTGPELNTYLCGLFSLAADLLADYDPNVRHTRRELVSYLHILLSAAILCEKLIPQPREDLPREAHTQLWIDEPNREVWVEGRQVQLPAQEFDLLLYLYNRKGQLCSRSAIAENVLKAQYEGMSEMEKKRMEETRLNSTMSRLRNKIEPNPDHPRYISTVRGEGYKFELERD